MRGLPFKIEIFGPIWKVKSVYLSDHQSYFPSKAKATYATFRLIGVDVVMGLMGIRTRGVGHWSKYRIENRGVARLPVIIHRLSHSWDSVGKFGALSFGFGHRPPVPFTLTSVSSPFAQSLPHLCPRLRLLFDRAVANLRVWTLFGRSSVWSLPLLWHTVVNLFCTSN